MGDKIDLAIVTDAAAGASACRVEVLDNALLGHEAILSLHLRIDVQRSSGVDVSREVFRHALRLDRQRIDIALPPAVLAHYAYDGESIRMHLMARIEVDDGVLFDTDVKRDIGGATLPRPEIRDDPAALMDPKDAFDLAANLRAIPADARTKTYALMAAGAVLLLANTLLGWHDQWVPEAQTFFYSHVDSEGGSESPLLNSIMTSGVLGGLLWFAIRRQLRRYMTLEWKPRARQSIPRGTRLRIADLAQGVARVPLERVVVQVVACNREHGQYTEKDSDGKTQTRSFTRIVRAVRLYRREIGRIPAGAPIEGFCDGEVDFDTMYAALYPPQMVGSRHGVDVHWELHLLHPLFVDQSIEGDGRSWVARDFWKA